VPLTVFTGVCSSPLLKKVDFILFLNKCDLLESKLRKRISFKKYVTSYKGPETFEDVIHCTPVPLSFRTFSLTISLLRIVFKATFIATWRRANETLKVAHGRTLHIHRTTVVDSRATRKLLNDGEGSLLPSTRCYLLVLAMCSEGCCRTVIFERYCSVII